MDENKYAPFWDLLKPKEVEAVPIITQQLGQFGILMQKCYDCGVNVQFIEMKRSSEPDMQYSGLLLKRVLTDLRVLWHNCVGGYTAQAATITTSLFENALAMEVIAGNPERAKIISESEGGDLPWSVKQMASFYEADRGYEEDEKGFIYYNYRALCKIKHPTLPSLLHEAGSTKTADGKYVIMALPNKSAEDLGAKGVICAAAIHNTRLAIDAFVRAGEPDYSSIRYKKCNEVFASIDDALPKAFTEATKDGVPFQLDRHTYKIRSYRSPFNK